MIKVSFVVIAYNIEDYIEKCILSILKQTIKEIEIIVVNDGSTDKTLEKINSLSLIDKRIIILNQENSGANSARKNGYLKTKGEYIVFVDGDDWINNKLVEDLYPMAKEKKYDIIQYNYIESYDNCENRKNQNIYEDIKELDFLKLNLEQRIVHTFWNKIYRKNFLDICNFEDIPNITMGDDLIANIIISLNRPKVKFVKEAYYYYYQRSTAITKRLSKKTLEIETCISSIEKYLKYYDLFDEYEEQINFLWFIHCYYQKVIANGSKNVKIRKELYDIWTGKQIIWRKNLFIKEYLRKVSRKNKILVEIYSINFWIGNILSAMLSVFIKLLNKFNISIFL